MKINKLRFVGGQTVDFPMQGANPSGPFILKGVDGLGPPDVVVKIAETIQEGGVYQGRRATNRQVVARVGLQPEWDTGQTPEELRSMLYSLMTPKYGMMAMVQAMRDNVIIGEAPGQVSKIDPAIFAKDPEVQITLDTTSPYLKAPALLYQAPGRTNVTAPNTILTIQNEGDAPTGFWMTITFTSAFSGTLLFNDGQSGGQGISLSGVSFAAGDKFTFDTRDKMRGVWKTTAAGAVSSLLNNMSDASVWIQLYGGANQFVINTQAFDIPANSFAHVPTFWGV